MLITTRWRLFALMLVAGLAFSPIGARGCSATGQDVFEVGNTATDAACNYSTIQAAVNAATCAAGTRIYLTDEVAYTSQHVSISNKNIALIGRASGAKCGSLSAVCGFTFPCPTAPLRTIEGNLKIRGTSNVIVQYLTITNGHGVADSNGTTYGGAIDYAATGELDIETSTIEYNTADNGGGIRFQGYGGAADLYLHSHTQIDHNTTTNGGSGGGIRLEGNSMLHVDESNTWIHDNVAAGKGGGIVVVGPAQAHIGSSGDSFFGTPVGVVSYNTAHYGGGIAEVSNSTGNTLVDLYASNPSRPVRIEHNRAYNTGGGVYLQPYTYQGPAGGFLIALSSVELGGAQVDYNKAPEGSGIYADLTSGTVGERGGAIYAYPGHCAHGIECNTVSYNQAVTVDSGGNDVATAGSAILLQTDALLQAQQLAMRGNQGAHVIRVADGLLAPLQLDGCLMAGNSVTAELITTASASATFTQCTFAYNSIGGGSVLRVASGLTLTNSIFAQGPLASIYSPAASPNFDIDYVLSLETNSLSSGQHIIQADPSFTNPGGGDFHLGAYSLAIDNAPQGDADTDLDSNPRDLDMANVTNLAGPRDLGAYERQSPFACGISDTIFCNGFQP